MRLWKLLIIFWACYLLGYIFTMKAYGAEEAVSTSKLPTLEYYNKKTPKADPELYNRVKVIGGTVLLDGSAITTGRHTFNKTIELVATSTPTVTVSTGHAVVFYSSSPASICYKNQTDINCLTAGITGVTAGYGLVGGGTTGNVTVGLNPSVTDFYHVTDKISLSTGTTGLLGYQISLSSQTMNTLGYAVSSSTGSMGTRVIKIVSTTSVTSFSTTMTAFQKTNLIGSITPTYTTSKILVIASGTGEGNSANDSDFTIFSNGVNKGGSNGFVMATTNVAATLFRMPVTLHYLDSPATTSQVTYYVGLRVTGGTGTFGDGANDTQHMIMMEIAQ
jgi:hypothetical protein